MTSYFSVLLSCLFLACQGMASQDDNQQIKEMINKMIDAKMTVEKKEMEEKMEVLREEMQEKDNRMKKQLDLLETRNAEMTTKLKEVDRKSITDLPYVMACAFRYNWATASASSTITYERLSVDYNSGGGDGDMDISTGKFTALTPGHYTVTFSGVAGMSPGEQVYFQLMLNDKYAGDEGEWRSLPSSSNSFSNDQGSRTVVSV